jgi:hypothetical protein
MMRGSLRRFTYASTALALIVLVLSTHASADAASLRRLFFSADERAQMDAKRSAPKAIVPSPQPMTPPAPVVPDVKDQPRSTIVAAPPVKKKKAPQRTQVMTGFVERSSGTNTVWINNQAQALEGGYGELDALDVGKARRK